MTNRIIIPVSLLVALAVLLSLSLNAAEKTGTHTHGMTHNATVDTLRMPQEGGHATFAALVEIVAILEQDANTDWDNVDINSLRAHLLDMNYLMLESDATTSILGDTRIQFQIKGTIASIPSIHRMVPAHARFIEQSRGWMIKPELTKDGAVLTITVEEQALVTRLNALGFYGFMSLDSHHQAHHFQMANGISH